MTALYTWPMWIAFFALVMGAGLVHRARCLVGRHDWLDVGGLLAGGGSAARSCSHCGRRERRVLIVAQINYVIAGQTHIGPVVYRWTWERD